MSSVQSNYFSNSVDNEQLEFFNPKIKKELISWISDSSVSGKKLEAAKRINDAFEKNANSLDLSSLRLSILPPCIGRLKKLEHLNLDSNALETIPGTIKQLAKLKFLQLNINKLKFLPEEMGELTALMHLSFNYNRDLQHLPLSLGNIPQLTSICHGGSGVSDKERNAILHKCRFSATQEGIHCEEYEKEKTEAKASFKVDQLLFAKRPSEVQKKIDLVYQSVKDRVHPWLHNGTYGFRGLLGFDDGDVIAQRIDKAHPDKKDLYFLDLGSGQHAWVDDARRFLDNRYEGDKRRFHVIGVTGEGESFVEKKEHGNVTTYKVRGFKLENLLESFDQLGFQLLNSVEFIVTSSTLCHLVDPLGTLDQAYHLLAYENGLMFGTGFYDVSPRKYYLYDTLATAFGRQNVILRGKDKLPEFALFRPESYACYGAKETFSYDDENPILKLSPRDLSSIECTTNFKPIEENIMARVFGYGFYGSSTYALEQLLGYGERRFVYKNTHFCGKLFEQERLFEYYLNWAQDNGGSIELGS